MAPHEEKALSLPTSAQDQGSVILRQRPHSFDVTMQHAMRASASSIVST